MRLGVGAWVLVREVVDAKYVPIHGTRDEKRWFIRRPVEPFQGVIVGATHLQMGSRWLEDGVGYHFEQGKWGCPQLVYLVRRGMLNRPVRVFEDGCELCEEPATGLPWQYANDPGGWKRGR